MMAAMTERSAVRSWVEGYERAWRTPGTAEISALFTTMPPICILRPKSPSWASTPLVECGKKTGRGQTRCLRSPPSL